MVLAPAGGGGKTLRQMMQWLHDTRNVNFVYDASLNVDTEYRGLPPDKLTTRKALRMMFDNTDIDYHIQGSYIILKPKHGDAPGQRRRATHTLSGIVRDESGEPLINATVYDLTDGMGTTTNEHGFFSLTMPEGDHQMRYSYIGYAERVERLRLGKDTHLDIPLHADTRLPEVVVTGDLNSPLLTTQTGKRSLTQEDIKTEFSLLSSPDLVKTLQRSSGVAEGMDLMSGIFVHGGNGDENLFLLDGTPLYDINHCAGLFSSFNPEVVKNVDFYKSGFPARYDGRLSSVVDVRTKDGNMERLHGSYRIGMLDAGVHLEGPIQKDRTSFNFGLRRSYIDLFTWMIPWSDDENDVSIGTHFTDLNAKLTHYANPRSKLAFSLYYGDDSYHAKDVYGETDYGDGHWEEETHYKLEWGNFNAALDWNYQFSPRLFANFTAVYTHNRSKLYGYDDERWRDKESGDSNISHREHSYNNTIDDIGYRMAFDFRPTPSHHIRFGHDYSCHIMQPQTVRQQNFTGSESDVMDTVRIDTRNRQTAHELSAYAEDEMRLSGRWSLNAGFHASLFSIGGRTFANIDPRLALKYQFSATVSLKASLTRMTQYMHKISNTYLSLPTDYWVPTTSRLRPMYAWQAAAGIYCQPNRHWTLSLEGYYKRSQHILQYSNWLGIEPPADRWDQMVMDGRGVFYGMELDATYRTQRLELSGSYTLSWNKRRYDDFYPDWFYDKYDNRHKINISLRCRTGKKSSLYAAWSYHSGYHTTVPTQVAMQPALPDGDGKTESGTGDVALISTRPNNVSLPDYHRLDVGFDFRHTTRKHHNERIWNISLFNVYCRRNALYMTVDYNQMTERYVAHTTSITPFLLPSCSYTIKF